MKKFIIYLLLFGLPLIYFPLSGNPFEPPKVIVGEFLTVLLLLITVWNNDHHISKLNKGALSAILIIFFLSLIPLLVTQTDTGVFGNKFRLQGTILLWHLLAFSIVSSTVKFQNIQKGVAVTFSVLAILTMTMPLNAAKRAIGTLGEPNALAAVFIFLVPFLLFFKEKWIRYSFIGIMGVMLFLTGSRSATIAFGIQLFALFLIEKYKFSHLKVTLISIVIIVLSYSLPFFEIDRVFENRVQVWNTAIHTAIKRPIFGYGFGNAEIGIKASAEDLQNTIQYQYVDSAHNILLDWFIQGGIIGLGLLLFLLSNHFKSAIYQKDTRQILCSIGLLTCLSFNPLSSVSLFALWWIIGQGLVSPEKRGLDT